MLALTELHACEYSLKWPFNYHALLLSDSLQELNAAILKAQANCAMTHRFLIPHAHVAAADYHKLRNLGIPVMTPETNDPEEHGIQKVDPFFDPPR
jgi:hypothetical protein